MGLPRKTRGEYRTIFESITTHPAFIAFQPNTKLVFYTLKLSCGALGIRAWPGLDAALAEMTALSVKDVQKALAALAHAKWIVRDGPMVWIIEGLDNEPQLSHGEKHQKYIATVLAGLPSCAVVNAFKRRYRDFLPLSDRLPDTPLDTLSHGVGDTNQQDHQQDKTSPTPTTTDNGNADLATRNRCRLSVVVAANSGITKQFGEQPDPINYSAASTHKFVDAILSHGVDIEFAAATVHAYAAENRPSDGKAPKHMHYFTDLVIRRWNGAQANLHARDYVHHPQAAIRALPEVNAFHLQCIEYARGGDEEYQAECRKLGLTWENAA